MFFAGVVVMKRLEAIIRPEKVEACKNALADAGFSGLTVTEVRGRGRQMGIVSSLPENSGQDLVPKNKLEMVVEDKDVEKAVDIVLKNARTGAIGDGKIFISDINECIRIRTEERGKDAI